MDATIHQNMQDLIAVRRLLLHASELESARKNPRAKAKTLKDEYEEDQAILSGDLSAGESSKNTPHKVENENINLKDIVGQAAFQGNAGQPVLGKTAQITIKEKTTVTEELEINYDALAPVDGLVVRSKNLAETDRYRFEFSDGATFKIIDKWAGKSTTIWGDPHVDVSDVEGNNNGDFKDLKGSDTQTTFMLLDGTRVTFTARDAGIIEAVDIFKGSQHASGIGAGSKFWSDKNALFDLKVGSSTDASPVAMGDVVYAGGDGNDWFDASHKLIWGKTTGPEIVARPSAYLQVNYRSTIQKQVAVTVDQTA